jgi:hypothetical protein
MMRERCDLAPNLLARFVDLQQSFFTPFTFTHRAAPQCFVFTMVILPFFHATMEHASRQSAERGRAFSFGDGRTRA